MLEDIIEGTDDALGRTIQKGRDDALGGHYICEG